MRTRQLLTVWNPYYEPHTIQVHAEILQRQQEDHRVWWARLYMGTRRFDEAAARERYPHVADVADEARREGRDLVLYTTNYQVLHALKVEEVVFGSALDPAEAPFVPPYYKRELPQPVLWFKVRDIRALAFNQLDTLRYFLESGEIVSGKSGYDPYAAFHHDYPIVVEAPPAEVTFDPAGLKRKKRLYVDHPETVFPPEVELARKELEELMGGVWLGLEEKSQAFLATSWLVYGQYQDTRGFDLSAAFSGVARAVETEVCEGVVEPFLTLVRRQLGEEELLRRFGPASRLTLGKARAVLDASKEIALPLGLRWMWQLASHGEWRKWLDDFVAIRNDASHVTELSKRRVRKRWSEIFVAEGESRLEQVVRAKQQVLLRLGDRAQEDPGPLLQRIT